MSYKRFFTQGVAVAAILAAGLLPAAAQTRITVSQSSDTLTLDPSKDTSPISLNIFKNVFDQLTDIDADGNVAPLLAKSWEANGDATVWTFTLVDGATFHDGTPVTPADVVWSYEKTKADTTSPVSTYLAAMQSIEAVGDNQVRITLSQSFAPFQRQVSLISILPKAAYEADPEGFATKPVGSGPFRAVEWVKDDHVTLAAFDAYHGGRPQVDEVIFRPVPSETTRTSALLSGELDIVPILPPAFIDRLKATPGISVETVAANRVLYLGFDVNVAPLDNVKLRQAIDAAIDRNAITQQLLRGLGVPLGQIVAPVTYGYDASIEPTAYDPDRARALLAESGYDGTPILFQFPSNRYAFGQEVAQAVAGYLSEVGINVEMQGMEYSAFFPLWAGRKLNGMHMFAFGPSIMDSDLPLRSLFESGPCRCYWTTPEVDALIVAQRAEADPARRAEIISQVWHLAKENVPYVILYNEVQAYGIRDGVNWRPRPDERLPFARASVQ